MFTECRRIRASSSSTSAFCQALDSFSAREVLMCGTSASSATEDCKARRAEPKRSTRTRVRWVPMPCTSRSASMARVSSSMGCLLSSKRSISIRPSFQLILDVHKRFIDAKYHDEDLAIDAPHEGPDEQQQQSANDAGGAAARDHPHERQDGDEKDSAPENDRDDVGNDHPPKHQD